MGTDDDLDVEDCFGEHNVEYWVRRGNRLVPATADEVARIHAWERERNMLVRLERLKDEERRRRTIIFRLRAVVRRWMPRAYRGQQPERLSEGVNTAETDQQAHANV
jgi:hypothetical protein